MPTPVWFVTAASSGFGREIALLALSRGHTVVATARSTSRLEDLARLGAHTMALDVTASPDDLAAKARDVFARFGRVDYMINAAGFILDAAVEEMSDRELRATLDTNVVGIANTIGAFLGGMREQDIGDDGTRGTVVTFGSVGSWRGGPGFAAYAMAKSSMSSLAETLRSELADFQITATVVEPGYFRTAFLNPGVRVVSERRIPAYEDPATATGRTRRFLEARDGKQPGDVKKGCSVIVDILTRSGVAEDREVPVRIVLGKDCDAFIREECANTIKLLDEWKDVFTSTDHDDVEA